MTTFELLEHLSDQAKQSSLPYSNALEDDAVRARLPTPMTLSYEDRLDIVFVLLLLGV